VFIHYTRDLRFDDRPDYGFLKRLIKTIAEREKIEFDYNFDWISKKNEEKTEGGESIPEGTGKKSVDSTNVMPVEKNEIGNLQSNKATNNDNTNSDQINLGSSGLKVEKKNVAKKSG